MIYKYHNYLIIRLFLNIKYILEIFYKIDNKYIVFIEIIKEKKLISEILKYISYKLF